MTSYYPPPRMRWSGATGAIARGKRVSTGCGRTRRSGRAWRWICGVKPTPKAGNKPSPHSIVHGLDKPGVFTTVSMIPNIKENPRNRKATKRGRKRLFNAAIHALRERVERTFAWEDKFKRLLLRFEYIQRRYYGMKLMAYTLINVRRFCSA